ncbi:DM9 repeat-containing protein [Legionella fallonii]|uniref:Uncharacterized protein n=1 Tax=Legionella fallonii LLAP-10 TaxID=1212491 RepID=A0A098G2R9_9GAMM|nr:DM9 repeat-containing protein [Legionella fallonii]CEG55785.1 conserved exported protein of unknown function [Legionella fallonii LLAP-10]
MHRVVFTFFMSLAVNNLWANIYSYSASPLATALIIGNKANGTAYLFCRAKLFNSIHPGKTWAGYNRCLVPYNGKEYAVSEFTIPNQLEFGHVNWTHTGGQAHTALITGQDITGKSLYLCRSFFRGGVEPGKTWDGYNHCNITFSGHEVISHDYRVLTKLN